MKDNPPNGSTAKTPGHPGTNPNMNAWICKHALCSCDALMNSGILKN